MKNACGFFLRGVAVTAAMLTSLLLLASPADAQEHEKHVRVSVVSDGTHGHVLFHGPKDNGVAPALQSDAHAKNQWYLRHPEAWWPQHSGHYRDLKKASTRDWSTTLGTTTYEPMYDFNFSINGQAGFGSLNTNDQGNASFLATVGSLTVTGPGEIGTYPLTPGGPAQTLSPLQSFNIDNLLFPTASPTIDNNGLLFTSGGREINIWSNSAVQYEYDTSVTRQVYVDDQKGTPFNLRVDPGAGQTAPSKFNFDVTLAPSCTNDFVTMGIPSLPVSGGQANVVGYINLYTEPGGTGFCSGTGPTVKYAYASGTGEVPGAVIISQFGTYLNYIENLLTGSSYFHQLQIGTTGNNGTGPTGAAVPGVGNNAVDTRILLSPDGGTTNQSSTTSPFIVYTNDEASDVAYVTTYSTAGTGSGYLYKITPVFGPTTPRIFWSVPITAIPSSPVYDPVSNKVFFTDNAGRIDYVVDSGTPTVVYGSTVAAGATSTNQPTLDSTNQMVYATFNTNGTNAVVVQVPTSLASSVTVPVGSGTTLYGGPYGVDFNNAFYTGVGTPKMYVAGYGSTATATPTLYGVGFTGTVLNPSGVTSTPLATGLADASTPTEFYNSNLAKDFLFVGVTNHCAATTGGGTAGCMMSLDITSGFPTVSASTTALAAAGGTTGIAIDNNSNASQASSIYYATKTGSTLVKATQAALK